MNNKSKKTAKQTKDESFSSTKKSKNSQEELQESGQNTNNVNRNIVKDSEEQPNKSGADDIEKQNSELNDEIENLRDEKLRLLAEMENLRKRSAKDKIESIKYGSINLARDILSPGDNLSRALDSIPLSENKSETFNNLIDGLMMVQKEFITILEKHGVKKIESINKKFDHNFHQAVFEIETDESEEGYVVREIQTGFTMHNRLLRPSMVGVSKKPENRKKDQKTE